MGNKYELVNKDHHELHWLITKWLVRKHPEVFDDFFRELVEGSDLIERIDEEIENSKELM